MENVTSIKVNDTGNSFIVGEITMPVTDSLLFFFFLVFIFFPAE
jgi:hypothetical protein